jgi:nitrogen-specific signal transduction histidine kinase
VQAHGGTVDARSQDGLTAFRMLFPMRHVRRGGAATTKF